MIRKLWGYRVDVLLLGLQADAATQPRVFVFQITVSVLDSSTVLHGSWAVRWSKSNRGMGNLLPFHLLLMLKPPLGQTAAFFPRVAVELYHSVALSAFPSNVSTRCWHDVAGGGEAQPAQAVQNAS